MCVFRIKTIKKCYCHIVHFTLCLNPSSVQLSDDLHNRLKSSHIPGEFACFPQWGNITAVSLMIISPHYQVCCVYNVCSNLQRCFRVSRWSFCNILSQNLPLLTAVRCVCVGEFSVINQVRQMHLVLLLFLIKLKYFVQSLNLYFGILCFYIGLVIFVLCSKQFSNFLVTFLVSFVKEFNIK